MNAAQNAYGADLAAQIKEELAAMDRQAEAYDRLIATLRQTSKPAKD